MSSSLSNRVNLAAKRRRKGLTLIEAAMVLTVLALVVAGVMLFYQNATTSQKISQAAGQISSIQQAVRSMFAGQSSYEGLQNANIITALPRSMISGTDGIRNAFNGNVVVAPASSGTGLSANAFTISFAGLPVDACVRLAAIDIGRSALSLSVNGAAAAAPPFNPTKAQTDCGSNNSSTLVWTLY